jgi:hypothetical protein
MRKIADCLFRKVFYSETIFLKLLRIPGIGSKESIPPAYVAWRVGTTTLFLFGSWPPQVVLKEVETGYVKKKIKDPRLHQILS